MAQQEKPMIDILAIPMQENDSGATTIRGYLKALLAALWKEGEGFSGKRPFGNSGWEYELYRELVAARAIPGTLDADGYLGEFDEKAGMKVILDAIEAL